MNTLCTDGVELSSMAPILLRSVIHRQIKAFGNTVIINGHMQNIVTLEIAPRGYIPIFNSDGSIVPSSLSKFFMLQTKNLPSSPSLSASWAVEAAFGRGHLAQNVVVNLLGDVRKNVITGESESVEITRLNWALS